MCIIALSFSGYKITKDQIEYYSYANPDGISIVDYRTGKPKLFRSLSQKEFVKYYKKIPEGTPHVVHFRYGTGGTKSIANCHGFKVHSCYLFHNGIADINHSFSQSDTAKLAILLQNLFTEKQLIYNFRNIMEKKLSVITNSGRFVLCTPDKMLTSGKWLHDKENDIYYSTNYHVGVIPATIPIPCTTLARWGYQSKDWYGIGDTY
jgi:hypothetical protein